MPSSPPEASSTTCEGYIVRASSTNFVDGDIYSTSTTNVTLSTLTMTGLDSKTTYWFRIGSLNWAGVVNYTGISSTLTVNASPEINMIHPSIANGTTIFFQVKVIDEDDISADISFKYYMNGTYSTGTIEGAGNISTGTLRQCTWYVVNDSLIKETTTYIRIYVNDVPLSTSTADTVVFNIDSIGPDQVVPSFPLTAASNISINTIIASSIGIDMSTVTHYMFNIDVASDFNTNPNTSTWLTVAEWYPTGLQPVTTYWWRVKAKDNWNNECGWSVNASSFVTGATAATNTYDFSESTGVDRWAWYADIFASTDSSGGTAFDEALGYGAIGINDGSSTDHSGLDDANPVTEMYLFKLSEQDISSFTVTWRGWGADGNDDSAPELYIWDFSGTPAWKLLKTGVVASGSDQVLSSTTVENISNYIQNGDCVIKAVIPSVNSNKPCGIYSNYVNIDINEIPNIPPEIPSYVDLMPLAPGTTDYLVCTASGSYDANGDSVTYKYNWFRDSQSYGSVQSSGTDYGAYGNRDFSISLSSDNTSMGEEWYCIVWAEDAEGGVSPAGLKTNVVNIIYPKPKDAAVGVMNISSATLSWSKQSLADGYILEASTNSDFSTLYTSSSTSNINDLSLTVFGLTLNTTYYFNVGNTFGAYTEWLTGSQYLAGCTPAQEPQAVAFSDIYESSVTVSWNDVDCVGYKVEASTKADFSGVIKSSLTMNGDAQQLTVEDLYTNTTYYYRAGALSHSNIFSYASEIATVTLARSVSDINASVVLSDSVTMVWDAHPRSPPEASSMTCTGYIVQASSTNFVDGDIYSTSTTNVSLNTMTVSGLSEKTTYYFKVGAYNWSNVVNYVTAGFVMTAPTPVEPAGLHLNNVNLSDAELGWDKNSDADKYILQASTDSNYDPVHSSSATYNVNLNTLTVIGLHPNTTFYFRAGNLFGSTTKWTLTTASTSTLANKVVGVSIKEALYNSVTLAWNAHPASPPEASSTTCEGYIVLASSTNFVDGDIYSTSTTNVSLSTLTVSNLSAEITYWFRVGAYNWNGVANYLSSGNTETAAAPSEPTGFNLVDVVLSTATLAWDKNSDADKYILQASTDSNYEPVHSSSITYNTNLTTLTVTGLHPNTTFYFRAGNLFDATTNWVLTNISTSTLANKVAGVDIKAVYKSSVTLAWDAHPASPPEASSTTCEGYIVLASSTNFVDGDIYSTSTTNVSLSTLTVSNLSYGTTYYFKVGAYNWQDIANYLTSGSTCTNTGVMPDTTAPEAITTFSASTVTSTGRITLEWEAPGDNGWTGTLGGIADNAQYRIQYETFTPVSWSTASYNVLVDTYDVTPHDIQDKTIVLSQETTYYFRIWSRDELSAGNWSAISSGATIWCRIAPGTVTDLSSTAEDDGSVTLTWTAPGDDAYSGNITSGTYRVGWSTVALVDWSAAVGWNDYDNKYSLEFDTHSAVQGETYSRVVTGLRGGATYYFRIWTRDEDSNVTDSDPNYSGNWSVMSATAGVRITEVISISVSPNTYDFNLIKVNTSTNSLSAVTVTNTGNVDELYSLKIGSITLADNSTSLWKSTDTTVGLNRFMLYSVFNSTSMGLSDFQLTDDSATPQSAGITACAAACSLHTSLFGAPSVQLVMVITVFSNVNVTSPVFSITSSVTFPVDEFTSTFPSDMLFGDIVKTLFTKGVTVKVTFCVLVSTANAAPAATSNNAGNNTINFLNIIFLLFTSIFSAIFS